MECISQEKQLSAGRRTIDGYDVETCLCEAGNPQEAFDRLARQTCVTRSKEKKGRLIIR